MKRSYIKGTVHSNIQIANNIYELKVGQSLFTPQNSKECDPEMDRISPTFEGTQQVLGFQGSPGQFYMIKSWELDPFLSRPLSICNISNNMITFLYEIRGKGTKILSKLNTGSTLELLGPLGNGFNLNLEANIAIISGGIGIAPMIYLIEQLNGNIDFYCGFRNQIYYIDKIKNKVRNTYITTEDGSIGHKGFITELFVPEKYDTVLTCGPIPMMKKIVEMCREKGIPAYISMENRMACGFGACLGCTIETISGMKRVCKDGPVFLGEEVVFND